MVVRRPLGKRCQIGGFLQVQLVDRLVKIGQRRAGDAIGIQAVEDLVEIEFEDAVLRIGLLDAKGQYRLADLPVEGPLGTQEEVLGDLLGDRRSADQPFARLVVFDVGDDGADKPLIVQTGMVVEVLVLGRQERRLDPVGHGLDRQVQPPLAACSDIKLPSAAWMRVVTGGS